MNENQQDNSSSKTTIQQSNEKILQPNKTSKNNNIKDKKKKFKLLIYIKQTFNKLKKNYDLFFSKFLLLTHFIIFLIPFSLLLFFSVYFLHYFGFERIFKFDYFYAVENEYLKYLITDIDDAHFEITSLEIESQFEDVDNLYFFKIYFQELISMGLLNEEPPTKIFPNISINSESIYQNIDKILLNNNINLIYTIPNNESKTFIDNREDNLSEIAKLYYYFLPLITYEASTKKTYINQTYLIAYEYDNKTKNIKGNELYFTYPRINGEISNLSNFYPANNLMSPQIKNNKSEHGEKLNDSFYLENWFIQEDYNYRLIANHMKCCDIIFSNLNYNHLGILNKSNIVSIHSYYYSNEKSYIINIIFYIYQKEFKEESLEFSSFILFNDSLNNFTKEKYSDNDTFLISKLNIAELTISSSLKQYFHYGMFDKNYNFFKHGISYDTLDLELLSEPLKYYYSNEKFNIDLRQFSSLYLYSSLFRNLEYNKAKEDTKSLNEIIFINKNDIIQKVCEQINFISYINYLKKENIDCFDENNLLYYSERETQEDIFYFNYNTMPYCICLPLYCLKGLEKNFKLKKIEYLKNMVLPDKCKNDFKSYLNGLREYFKSQPEEHNILLEFNFGLNNLNIFSNNLKESIEDEFFIFKTIKFPQIPKITFMIVSFVNNISLKGLLIDLLNKIDAIKSYYIIIELSGLIISLIVGNTIIIINIKKISNVIFNYEKIHKKFLNKLELSSNKDIYSKKSNDNIFFNSFNKLERINYSDNLSIIKNEKVVDNNIYNNNFFSNDNSLLNELLILYSKYYNISKEELIKMNYYSKHKNNKIKNTKKEEENELFKFLKIISVYIPKFKLNISMDYNFYIDSKLNINYLKSITKEQLLNDQFKTFTQSVIYELLSTEKVENFGLISNLSFKYLTNININPKKDNKSIKNSMFSYVEEKMKNDEQKYSINKNDIFIEGENKNDNIKIIWKEKNKILEEFESNFESDDYLKKGKLRSAFDSFLINAYYKYLKKIVFLNSSSNFEEKLE